LRTSELDYHLPQDLIAQRPAEPRDAARLMVVDVGSGRIEHRTFRDLPEYLGAGDAVVLNETRVIPARLRARKSTGGEVELLFLRELGDGWEALARPGRRLREGMVLSADGRRLELAERREEGRWLVRGAGIRELLEERGHMPLPPYIRSTPEAERAYQTVYARNAGSAAAPTAGFHFTEELLERVRLTGAQLARITLHVGTGTFLPVRTGRLEDHRMHSEWYSVPPEAVEAISEAERVVAVGTTVARTLESRARSGADEGETDIFIYPGYRWWAVDALVTNFHLPRSTLLAMIMSFAGEELVREAYRVAVEERYRFYSFGDAMLLLGGGRNVS
jgi:S-adenosylmethionine:tRNA ribosyltransferase-isomerase